MPRKAKQSTTNTAEDTPASGGADLLMSLAATAASALEGDSESKTAPPNGMPSQFMYPGAPPLLSAYPYIYGPHGIMPNPYYNPGFGVGRLPNLSYPPAPAQNQQEREDNDKKLTKRVISPANSTEEERPHKIHKVSPEPKKIITETDETEEQEEEGYFTPADSPAQTRASSAQNTPQEQSQKSFQARFFDTVSTPIMSPMRAAQLLLPKRKAVDSPANESSVDANDFHDAETGLTGQTRCVKSASQEPTDSDQEAKLPEFRHIINFPQYMRKPDKKCVTIDRNCVMCGQLRLDSQGLKKQGKSAASARKKGNEKMASSEFIIPAQNKGICTECDVIVWKLVSHELDIKWCKGCKNFRPWSCFGKKLHGTKCVRCRARQHDSYAKQKSDNKKGVPSGSATTSFQVNEAARMIDALRSIGH